MVLEKIENSIYSVLLIFPLDYYSSKGEAIFNSIIAVMLCVVDVCCVYCCPYERDVVNKVLRLHE